MPVNLIILHLFLQMTNFKSQAFAVATNYDNDAYSEDVIQQLEKAIEFWLR